LNSNRRERDLLFARCLAVRVLLDVGANQNPCDKGIPPDSFRSGLVLRLRLIGALA
jgi:hypothetical protein